MGIGVGTDVSVEDVIGAAGDHPGGVVVAAEASERGAGAEETDVVPEEIDRDGEVLGGFRRSEGEEWVGAGVLEKVEGAAHPLGVEGKRWGDVHVPPFARLGAFGSSVSGRGRVALAAQAGASGGGAVED